MSLLVRLQEFYLGFYGRPADPGGLAYWIEQANGAYLNQDSRMAAAFGSTDQAEFRALYGQAPSIELFVGRVYQNLFGRSAEAEGVVFFANTYNQYVFTGVSPDQARAILIARIIDGASGTDRIAITNKVSVAISVTDELKLKSAAISDASELLAMQSYFAGDGGDAWRATASDRVAQLVNSLQANDSVTDYMNVAVTSELGIVPLPDATQSLTYSRNFLLESDGNAGRISGSIQINLQGGKFAGSSGSSLGTVSNVPAGLTAKLVKLSDTDAQLTFTGAATTHSFAKSVSNITVSFQDKDFQGLTATAIEGHTKSNLGIGFIDAAISVVDGLVTATGSIANNLTVNLETNSLTLGTGVGRPIFGAVSAATGADFSATSGATGSGFLVSFVGDGNDNSYQASYVGDSIRGMGGNDELTGNIGKDTFIFEANAVSNGVDVIKGFDITVGDILNFSRFLNVTGTGLVATQSAVSEQVEWENGDVLVYQGPGISDAADVAALFDATGEDTTTPYDYARSDGKAVIITGYVGGLDVTGDAYIWYLVKDADANENFDANKNVVKDSEITLVGVLEDINNLALAPFASGNFL